MFKGIATGVELAHISRVAMLDGSLLEFNRTTSFNDSGTITKKYMSALPLDVEKVSQASINGQIVKFGH